MVREAIEFGPFRLDTDPDRLWRGSEEVPLRAKSLSVLAYLARRPGRLVTKDELREQVWGAAHVSDTTLRVTVRAIRAALGDDTTGSSYLETVPGINLGLVLGIETNRLRSADRHTGSVTRASSSAPRVDISEFRGSFPRLRVGAPQT